MECEESEELAVKTGVWLSILIVWGLDTSYCNFDLVSQPFCEQSVLLTLANIREKISKVAEDGFCVCDPATSPLAFWAARGSAAQANVGAPFCMVPLQCLELRPNNWAGFQDVH